MEQKYREILNPNFNFHLTSYFPISPTGKKSNTPPYMTYIRLERQDQRDLTEGYREPISASRASPRWYHRYAAFRRVPGDGSWHGGGFPGIPWRSYSRRPISIW